MYVYCRGVQMRSLGCMAGGFRLFNGQGGLCHVINVLIRHCGGWIGRFWGSRLRRSVLRACSSLPPYSAPPALPSALLVLHEA